MSTNQDCIPRSATDKCGSGWHGASRQQVFTATQVGSLLDDDTGFVFSGSDDDFDAGLDEELDPLEGNHEVI
jgi:hypothetical protein